MSQDRVVEKEFFRSLGVSTANFLPLDSSKDVEKIEESIGYPCILKTRRFGYDGKGQAKALNLKEAQAAFEQLGSKDIIAEQCIDFQRELSIVTVAKKGDIRFYPVVENFHEEGILRKTIAPAPLCSVDMTEAAQDIARKTAQALNYNGVFAIELFQTSTGFLVNEMAPRVHNSGHWTMDGCKVSQFENHVRAVMGLSLIHI